MTAVFNSLGSNYSTSFVTKAIQCLVGNRSSETQEKIKANLERHTGQSWTECILTYKGRHAMTLALEQLLKPGDLVVIQGFTCWAVEEAVLTAGMKPVFVDIATQTLNPSVTTLEKVYKQFPQIKAVIIQHTFGFAAPIEAIKSWADKKKIILIEDLAHSVGTKTDKKQLVGTFGQAAALSFGRDKIIDSISGGALLTDQPVDLTDQSVSSLSKSKDLIYPLVTWIIRNTYSLGIGKGIHFLTKRVGLMGSPIANSAPNPLPLPPAYWSLLSTSLEDLEATLVHRRKIASIYQEKLKPTLRIDEFDLDLSSCLRYPIKIKQKQALLEDLKSHQIYLSDTWFKEPVEKGHLLVSSSYQPGVCPEAEKLSQVIFNLPTHIQITPPKAEEIVSIVNCHQ